MNMRPSKVLKKLRSGEIVSCIKINLADSRVTDIAGLCGFDCVWLDMEHTANDWSVIENQIRSAKVYDMDTMVRVPRGSYSDYIKPLELDAAGIMVPHLMSLEDAKKVVWQTRFHPVGRRALDGGNQDGAYCMVEMDDYIKTANEDRFVLVQIEDPEPLDDLKVLAKLDGIDILFFGPTDFSHSIGRPGQKDYPLVNETRKLIAQVARDSGKFAGTVGRLDNIQELIEMGYQFIKVGADVVALSEYFKKILAGFNKANLKV